MSGRDDIQLWKVIVNQDLAEGGGVRQGRCNFNNRMNLNASFARSKASNARDSKCDETVQIMQQLHISISPALPTCAFG